MAASDVEPRKKKGVEANLLNDMSALAWMDLEQLHTCGESSTGARFTLVMKADVVVESLSAYSTQETNQCRN